MPVEQRLAFGERRQVIDIDEAAYCDRAQVRDCEFVTGLERVRRSRVECDCKKGAAVPQPEKGGLGRPAKILRRRRKEQRIETRLGPAQHHHVAGDDISAAGRIVLQCSQCGCVGTPMPRPIQKTCRIGKPRPGAEIGTNRHTRLQPDSACPSSMNLYAISIITSSEQGVGRRLHSLSVLPI